MTHVYRIAKESDLPKHCKIRKQDAHADLPPMRCEGDGFRGLSGSIVPRKNRKPKTTRKVTDYNEMLAFQLNEAQITHYCCEYMFDSERNWRIDFVFSGKLAVEIDGAVHRIKGRWEKSFEREQAIFFAGRRLLKVSTKQVRSGEAVDVIQRALAMLAA